MARVSYICFQHISNQNTQPNLTAKGCALRIQISTHSHRVYSVDTIYDSDAEAKAACAKAATDQGVLDFIMFGGGQKTPAVKMGPDDGELFTGECALESLKNQDVWTVVAFYEALPKTSSELQTSASYLDVNGPSWLNTTMQCIRGARLSVAFIWTEGTVGCECTTPRWLLGAQANSCSSPRLPFAPDKAGRVQVIPRRRAFPQARRGEACCMPSRDVPRNRGLLQSGCERSRRPSSSIHAQAS